MNDEVRAKLKEVLNADTVNALCQVAFRDEFNGAVVSGMTHEALHQHIADLQDLVRVLQSTIQANLTVDEEWSRAKSASERAALREKDRAYRARQRPATNEDGTAVEKPKAKRVSVNTTEGLIEKMMRTGMSRENAEKLIASMKQ